MYPPTGSGRGREERPPRPPRVEPPRVEPSSTEPPMFTTPDPKDVIYELLPGGLKNTDSKVAAYAAGGLTAGGAVLFLLHGLGIGTNLSEFFRSLISVVVTLGFGFAAGFMKKRKKVEAMKETK